MTNKILIVGVLDVPSSTNVFMKKGFEQLGYKVHDYNYRTVARELGSIHAMWDDFAAFIRDQKYALIVFCKTNEMHPGVLHFARKAGPVWYWFMDNTEVAIAIDAINYAKNADYASATSSDVVDKMLAVNKNSFHMTEGYDTDVYYYQDLPKIHDVVFIGNATEKRFRDISQLKHAGINIAIYGQGWPEGFSYPPVFNEEERIAICQSKFVLNLCHDEYIFSDRVIKSLACGASVLSQYSKDLDNKFPGAVGIFNTAEEAKEQICLELNETQELLALEIQKEMAERIKKYYSWKGVCKQIMEKVECSTRNDLGETKS